MAQEPQVLHKFPIEDNGCCMLAHNSISAYAGVRMDASTSVCMHTAIALYRLLYAAP